MFYYIYDIMINRHITKYDTTCQFCKNNIHLNDKIPYYFKIVGLGKYDKKTICFQCLNDKFTKK